jgi:uncharacterized protein (TIGR03086 family)
MDANTMRQACAATEPIIKGISPGLYPLATPCSAWNVHQLLNHLLGACALGAALLSDTAPTVDMVPGGLPTSDLAGADPVGAYQAAVEALLTAADAEAWTHAHATPLGELPGKLLGGYTTLDVLVHGWDLATATGQEPAVATSLAEEVLAFARVGITEQLRGTAIGPEVVIDAGAPVLDRLVAFLGRRP